MNRRADPPTDHDWLVDDVEVVRQYGSQVPEAFGGVYFDNDPPITVVALFTRRMDEHEATLRVRVKHPDRLVVRLTAKSWQAIERDTATVVDKLLIGHRQPRVWGVGIGLHEGHFVVKVDISPYSVAAAERIAALVHPIEVRLQKGGPVRLR
jgi:hypothetical protein